MKPTITPDTLRKIHQSNAELTTSEFKSIVERAGYRLNGRWDKRNRCPEIVKSMSPPSDENRRQPTVKGD